MSPEPSGAQLGEAVLNFVYKATYPDSEDIISAELLPSAFPVVLDLLEKARRELKVRNLSSVKLESKLNSML